MKITTKTLARAYSSRLCSSPSKPLRLKSGAGVPKRTILERKSTMTDRDKETQSPHYNDQKSRKQNPNSHLARGEEKNNKALGKGVGHHSDQNSKRSHRRTDAALESQMSHGNCDG